MIRVFSMFTGIGAYERALQNIGVNYELVGYCEIEDKRNKAYQLLHKVTQDKNHGDVTTLDTSEIEDFDLLTYSPPCVSFSVAGKQEGMKDVRGTLFYNALKVIQDKHPKYCVMENVDNLAIKFKEDFNLMLDSLDKAGYNNYWKIINAKDFLPQNRNRVYLVSIRKDIDDKTFEFPIGEDTRYWWEFINPYETRELTGSQKRKIDYVKGLNPTETVNIEGKPQFDRAIITLRTSGLRFQNNREHPTITAAYGRGGGNFTMLAYNGHIGGITPRQCFKLMGFEYEDADLLKANGFSVSSLYEMSGRTVVVPVLEGIFKNLLKEE